MRRDTPGGVSRNHITGENVKIKTGLFSYGRFIDLCDYTFVKYEINLIQLKMIATGPASPELVIMK